MTFTEIRRTERSERQHARLDGNAIRSNGVVDAPTSAAWKRWRELVHSKTKAKSARGYQGLWSIAPFLIINSYLVTCRPSTCTAAIGPVNMIMALVRSRLTFILPVLKFCCVHIIRSQAGPLAYISQQTPLRSRQAGWIFPLLTVLPACGVGDENIETRTHCHYIKYTRKLSPYKYIPSTFSRGGEHKFAILLISFHLYGKTSMVIWQKRETIVFYMKLINLIFTWTVYLTAYIQCILKFLVGITSTKSLSIWGNFINHYTVCIFMPCYYL